MCEYSREHSRVYVQQETSYRFLRGIFFKKYLSGARSEDRTVFYDPRVFFKIIFLVLYAAYFIVHGEGMGWGRKTRMEE